MATVTGITAAKADEILGMSVVSGSINESGHLILTRANGSTIDAGDFTGIVSGLLEDQVEAQIAAELPDVVAGTVLNMGSVTGAIDLTPAFNNVNLVNALVTLTATGNLTLSTADLPSSPKTNTQFAMKITQDPTGGRTLTLTGFKKSQGVLTLTTNGFAVDILVFMYDGTNWNAGMMGVDFK